YVKLSRRPVSRKSAAPVAFKLLYINASSSRDGRNQPRTPLKLSDAHSDAAVVSSLHAASMSRVFWRPVPIAVPRAPGISERKQPHFAPALWSNGAASR